MRILHHQTVGWTILVCASCAVVVNPAPPAAPVPSAFEIMAAVDRASTRALWPGFDARRTPVMIFDGSRTLLFNHPSPPSGFQVVAEHPDVLAMSGRHPQLTGNSSIDVGGVQTATVLLTNAEPSVDDAAALVVHEAFHVFQRQRHASWTANEVELFTFPVMDSAVVASQRMEAEALRRALIAPADAESACWASTAMDVRDERYAALSPGAAGYERGSELNEGIATYVASRVSGIPDSAVMRAAVFPPQAVRLRAYSTGFALARLLDRHARDWKERLESADITSLDALLRMALRQSNASSNCGFTDEERDVAIKLAAADVDSLRAQLEHSRLVFLGQPGWIVVVSAPADRPLFPQRFDPWNVTVLTGGEVLHTRHVKLGNQSGQMEVLDRSALTSPAGAHPLFNGVKTVTIAGLPQNLVVSRTSGAVTARANGLELELRGATVDTVGNTINIRLPR